MIGFVSKHVLSDLGRAAALLACWLCSAPLGAQPAGDLPPLERATSRQPVSAAWVNDGAQLAVANRRTGTISLVDCQAGKVVDEFAVAGVPNALISHSADRHLLVLVGGALETWAVDRQPARRLRRTTVAADAQRLLALPATDRVAVASPWSRQVAIVSLSDDRQHVFDLPFAAGDMLALADGRLLVADAFGGCLATLDLHAQQVLAVHEIAGHNILGLAHAPAHQAVLLAHQVIDPRIPASGENVRSGRLLRHVVSRLTYDELTTASVEPLMPREVWRLPGADPSALVAFADGRLLVALGGIDAVVQLAADGTTAQVAVGRRPVSLIASADRRHLYTVNQFADSLTEIELSDGESSARPAAGRTIRLGDRPPHTARELGEQLFFDARLAGGWISCHSCHTDGHTAGVLADTLGDETYGTPKRTPTLLGTGLTDFWGWNGRLRELPAQVAQSFATTMQADVSPADVLNVVAYLQTLKPPPPRQPVADNRADRALLERGRQVFLRQRCNQCHVPPLTYTSQESRDVGLVDEAGLDRFNPPSLRGVGHVRRLFHDGRAASLEAVFTDYGHQLDEELSPADLVALLRFLRSL